MALPRISECRARLIEPLPQALMPNSPTREEMEQRTDLLAKSAAKVCLIGAFDGMSVLNTPIDFRAFLSEKKAHAWLSD
jgi:hypothetical protein